MQIASKILIFFFFLMLGSTASAACFDNFKNETSVTARLECLKNELQILAAKKQKVKVELPKGSIVAWHGKGGVPSGWLICNGDNGTPDLRGVFIRGVGTIGEAGKDATAVSSHAHLGGTIASKAIVRQTTDKGK